MGSGPRTGLGEINLPDLQPGSSIMPGKVNPVIPEAMCMVAAQVIGNDAAITFSGASGNFELNVMLPVIARNILESIRLLANVSRLLADRCVHGITANADRMREYAESSPSIVTPLNPMSATRRPPRSPSRPWRSARPSARWSSNAGTSPTAPSPRNSSTPSSTCCP